ncbi:hypothetical protein [Bifidobacterium xylocopae]|uniref:Uncharacterized protein n=1 Tax=Bifidobacterium xylocopae TaxID=2493119 RepID=A0A366KEE8_9BIFI|nr:hypothetical protein [Bifidobacterium xylocopae]RBP99767.1 hypothetical protein CRD59_01630 [Bifidobacterium xylocopae]
MRIQRTGCAPDGPGKGARLPLRLGAAPIVILLIAACFEIFLVNMPYWCSLDASPQAGRSTLGPGLAAQGDHTAKVVDPKSAWRDISSTRPIDYLHFNPAPDLLSQTVAASSPDLSWTISTRRPTDGGWYDASAIHRYSIRVERTRYMHVGDGAHKVRLHYRVRAGDVIALDEVTVNPRVPFHVDGLRLLMEVLLVLIVLAFRPGGRLYRRTFTAGSIRSLLPLALLFAVEAAGIIGEWLVFGRNSVITAPHRMGSGMFFDPNQYADLADSLLHGRFDLDLPVNADLAAMDNPYDTASRLRLARAGSDTTPIFFDVAFKSGRYYCYFGLLPAVVAFMPYKLLTGHDLPASTAVLAFALLLALCSILLTVQLARWFSRRGGSVSLGCVLLAASGWLFVTPILYTLHSQVFYQLPQTLAISLTLLALSCWIEAKMRALGRGWLLAGSTCLALTLGCRPQFMLAAVLALPLFRTEIHDLWRRGLSSRSGLRDEALTWLCALGPFILLSIPILAYNAARFGSPIDFGADYNLTAYDMPNSRPPLSRLLPLSLLYFFQPPNVGTGFPFLLPTNQDISPWMPEQASYGGLFTLMAPFTLIVFGIWSYRRRLRGRRAAAFCWAAAATGIVIFAFTTHIAGYSPRYVLDFGWTLGLIYTCCILAVDGRRASQGQVEASSSVGGGRARPARLAPLSDPARMVFGTAAAGMVLAVIAAFLYVFVSHSLDNDLLWWDVYSWFLFL